MKPSIRRKRCSLCGSPGCRHVLLPWHAQKLVDGTVRGRMFNEWEDAVAWVLEGRITRETLWRVGDDLHANGRG